MLYWDTHCHLDKVINYDKDIINKLSNQNIAVICPSTHPNNFEQTIQLANFNIYFALGIHPLYSNNINLNDINTLRTYLFNLKNSSNNTKLIALGEIGLDFMCEVDREQQIFVFEEQLKLANEFNLPVLIHVRKSQDQVLKYLRKYNIHSGIAHAFNGSNQQANAYIKQGLKLGFGGSMTFTRALQIRRLAKELDLEHIMLETDAPDMLPAWQKNQVYVEHTYNTPLNIIGIYECLAQLRQINIQTIAQQMQINVEKMFKI